MWDPTRRSPGSWPRDRPIRWRGVAGNLTWFVVGTAAAIGQVALAVPVLVIGSQIPDTGYGQVARIVLALMWGALTLFAWWSWALGRWRVVIAPAITGIVLGFLSILTGL